MLNTFGSYENRDFRTRKNPSANIFLSGQFSAAYPFTKARGVNCFKRTSKPQVLCSILSGKIRLPEGFLYDTILLTYSVWCFNTKYSLFTSLRATFTMALLLGIRLYCSVKNRFIAGSWRTRPCRLYQVTAHNGVFMHGNVSCPVFFSTGVTHRNHPDIGGLLLCIAEARNVAYLR